MASDLDGVFDLHGQFAGRHQDQRTGGLRAALGAEPDDLRQDRQGEGRRLARTGLGDAEHVAAGHEGRNGLDLDRLGVGEAGGDGGFQQLAGNAESGKAFDDVNGSGVFRMGQVAVFLRRGPLGKTCSKAAGARTS